MIFVKENKNERQARTLSLDTDPEVAEDGTIERDEIRTVITGPRGKIYGVAYIERADLLDFALKAIDEFGDAGTVQRHYREHSNDWDTSCLLCTRQIREVLKEDNAR